MKVMAATTTFQTNLNNGIILREEDSGAIIPTGSMVSYIDEEYLLSDDDSDSNTGTDTNSDDKLELNAYDQNSTTTTTTGSSEASLLSSVEWKPKLLPVREEDLDFNVNFNSEASSFLPSYALNINAPQKSNIESRLESNHHKEERHLSVPFKEIKSLKNHNGWNGIEKKSFITSNEYINGLRKDFNLKL